MELKTFLDAVNHRDPAPLTAREQRKRDLLVRETGLDEAELPVAAYIASRAASAQESRDPAGEKRGTPDETEFQAERADPEKPENSGVVCVYRSLKERGYPGGKALLLLSDYFSGKSGDHMETLFDRLDAIMATRQDLLSSGILAASFYGLEELSMRLPVLESMLRNPFSDPAALDALTGTILPGDGGPAEGAKAMRMALEMEKYGIPVTDVPLTRLVGLLSILSGRPSELAARLCRDAEKKAGNLREAFFGVAADYVCDMLALRDEELEELNPTAANLLLGMKEEVRLILVASCLGV